MKPTVMLIGLGGLGSVLLELLVREKGIGRLLVAGRRIEQGQARCNLARLGALAQGYAPEVRFVELDLQRPEMVAEILTREAPDLVLSTATLLTWWLPSLLPVEQSAALNHFGMWLPVHLVLSMKLMQAVRIAGYRGPVLTAPFPDVVNHVLAGLDLAPTCGIGNLPEVVAKVQLLACQKLNVSMEAIQVLMVGHHALGDVAFGEHAAELPSYFLRVICDGQDVTEQLKAGELLLAPHPITSGPATHFLTAGTAIPLVTAMLAEREELLHAPAPNGLPGGYPVLASRAGVRVAPMAGLALEEAIEINERSHRFDGIERIEEDGTVVFCEAASEAFRTQLGYDCSRLRPSEAEERAAELIQRFRDYAVAHGVTLPTTS
ncbi:hypothetical protein EPA93_00275 [Ktedonosporobacter rubrisoli]|uniref:Saccharopine dehydrogenase NADP binding domain-containing protein n=1 Tax=Ktedonosporobacter rubrisoli TaxID=2509675 RepID=A0A4P6JHU4_KTERU|nr:saccharopine dehydrogenase NADP-binding domain-containing protein [Ktedonosporobacter rubrisoli]QBD74513.1 hypothetical protein EPA93_00275 [Ktedonosporobacter rubrisoli]